MTGLRVSVLGLLCLAATGCASVGRPGDRPPSEDVGSRAPATPASPATTGRASWYGEAHQGKKTASGEAYDMARLTAAHRTLPLGTRVRVTNVANGRAVVVRINDRGPFVAGRIIDLSQAAARALGALGAGVVTVRLEVLEDAAVESPPPTSRP